MLKSQILRKIGMTLFAMLAIAGTSGSVFSEASKPISQAKDMITAQNSELALARQVHQQVNEYRKSLNLAPLTLNAEISQQAKQHSQNMAENKVEFSHSGFDRRIKALSISYRSAAENVAYNQGYGNPVKQAVEGWIESEGHRQNMRGNYNLTGIGVVKNQQGEYYFTQIFILD